MPTIDSTGGGVNSLAPPGRRGPRPTAAAPDPATHHLNSLSRLPHPLASRSCLEARQPPPPPPPLLPPSPCPWPILRTRTTCQGNVEPPSAASSLTLMPGGYRTWFPVPIQTAARRSRVGTIRSGGRRRTAVPVRTEMAGGTDERAGPVADLRARRRNTPSTVLSPHLLAPSTLRCPSLLWAPEVHESAPQKARLPSRSQTDVSSPPTSRVSPRPALTTHKPLTAPQHTPINRTHCAPDGLCAHLPPVFDDTNDDGAGWGPTTENAG